MMDKMENDYSNRVRTFRADFFYFGNSIFPFALKLFLDLHIAPGAEGE
jgi:hypothetical protein